MNKKIYSIITVVLLVLFLGVFLYIPEYKIQQLNNQTKSQRTEDLKQNNPGLLEKLENGIKRDLEIVKNDKNNFEAYKNLAVAYQALGDYIKAEEAYKKAGEISPINTVIWNNLGHLYLSQKKYDQAEGSFLKLLEVDPTDVSAYLSLAEMYSQGFAGNIEDAKYILSQGILKTESGGLKEALERINREGKL